MKNNFLKTSEVYYIDGIQNMKDKGMKYKDVPKKWLLMLEEIQKYYPEAVIAGGALRDLQHDKEIKDIDVWVSHDADLENNLIELFGSNNIELHNDEEYEGFGTDDDRNISSIFNCKVKGITYTVQIISLYGKVNPETVCGTFDVGLCMIAHDGIDYFTSNEYLGDVVFNILSMKKRLNETDTEYLNRIRHSMKYISRIHSKYPDYSITL